MVFNVEVRGAEELCRVLERLPQEMHEEADAALRVGVEAVAEKAREVVPMRTGCLRSTIAATRIAALSWRVGATASYARHVEYGTSEMMPRPFLSTSLMLMRSHVVSLVRQSLAETVKRAER